MAFINRHHAPAYSTVFWGEVRNQWIRYRATAIMALILLTIATIIEVRTAATVPMSDVSRTPSILAIILIPLTIGLVLPFALWRDQNPSRRAYYWTMPVPRTPHTLLKLLAGWLWLVATIAVFCLSYIPALIIEADLPVLSHVPAIIIKTNLPVLVFQQFDPGSVAHWLAPFTVATIGYLLISAFVIASTYPGRWIVGVVFAYPVLQSMLLKGGWVTSANALSRVLWSDYGIASVLFGLWPSFIPFRPMTSPDPGVSTWLLATLLWVTVGGIGAWYAAWRYRET